jgi:4'-phosphopantetheinyl transferase
VNGTVTAGAVGWLLAHAEAVPEGDAWLTAEERAVEHRLLLVRRRADWRLGRWAAKQALVAWLPARAAESGEPARAAESGEPARAAESGEPARAAESGEPAAGCSVRPGQVGIVARGDDDGCPEVHGLDPPLPSLSLSHRDGVGLAVVASPGCRIGCDLERVESRSARFPRDWFTSSECDRLDDADPERRDELVTVLWSAKESVLKAVGEGLRRDTRSVEVDLGAAPVVGTAWVRVAAHDREDGTTYACWVRRLGPHVGVVAVDAAVASTAPPERLVAGWTA